MDTIGRIIDTSEGNALYRYNEILSQGITTNNVIMQAIMYSSHSITIFYLIRTPNFVHVIETFNAAFDD